LSQTDNLKYSAAGFSSTNQKRNHVNFLFHYLEIRYEKLSKKRKKVFFMRRISGTQALIIVLLLTFVGEVIFSQKIELIFSTFGFSLLNVLLGRWWVFLTSIFLHASLEHLALNVIALLFFGSAVEEKLGTAKMLGIFFVSSFVGELFILALSLLGLHPLDVPTVGASGGIFGLMGVAMLVKPFELIAYPYLVPFPLFLVALLYTITNFAYFIYHIVTGSPTDIAYAAHLGGVLTGIYIGLKESRNRKAVIILLFMLSLLTLPLLWEFLVFLEQFNYVGWLSSVMK
jgi:membrane associated rhomboid family serine protease